MSDKTLRACLKILLVQVKSFYSSNSQEKPFPLALSNSINLLAEYLKERRLLFSQEYRDILLNPIYLPSQGEEEEEFTTLKYILTREQGGGEQEKDWQF